MFMIFDLETSFDNPSAPVLEVIGALVRAGHHRVEIWSARSAGSWSDVVAWIESEGIDVGSRGAFTRAHLMMRQELDATDQIALRRQWLEAYARDGHGRPHFVFTDSLEGALMWIGAEIPCAQLLGARP